MSDPTYNIDPNLTAEAGQNFLKVLNSSQAALVTGLVQTEKVDLYEIVDRRRDISTQFLRFMTRGLADSTSIGRYPRMAAF